MSGKRESGGEPRRRSREQEGRALRVLRRIRRSSGATKAELARACGVSRRTIQRDLRLLADVYGAPLRYCRETGGFVLADPAWRFQHEHLDLSDLVPFVLAREALRVFRGANLAQPLAAIIARQEKDLTETERAELRAFAGRVSFEDEPRRVVRPRVLNALLAALREQRLVRATYGTPAENRARVVIFAPRRLAWIGGEWYVDGTERGRARRYAVSRLSAAVLGGAALPEPRADRGLEERKRFLRFPPPAGREVARVKVRFTAAAAPWVLERVWHRQQSVRRKRDGSLLLDFPAPSLFEAFRWSMAWGPEVEVLEPAALRRAVAAAARNMAAIHGRPRRRAALEDLRVLPDGLFA
ncbi:MAG: WYL domain-containing protein [Planctomycetes bacterium]|nr:WYL domain-containing protein [Planctomycetota bacterium]